MPDLRATQGSYTLFAAGRDAWEGYTQFGGRHLKIYPREGKAESRLEGPPDPRAPITPGPAAFKNTLAALERVLKDVAERVRDEIAALPGISNVEVASVREDEVSIEVSEAALRRYALTFDEVSDAVRRFSIDLSGGTLKTQGGEIRLRTLGQARTGAEFEQIVLRSGNDGTRLTLGDIAIVRDGFEEADLEARSRDRCRAIHGDRRRRRRRR